MVNEVKEPEKKPSRFAKLVSAVKDNKFVSSFVLETTPEDKKSQAHKKSDERAESFTKAFTQPIIMLKRIEQDAKGSTAKVAATAYKAVAGLIIDPKKLSETAKEHYKEHNLTSGRKDYAEKWIKAQDVVAKTKVASEFIVKEPVRMAVDAAQFVVRNTIKQPAMIMFRAGALVNNAAQYGYSSARKALASAPEDKARWGEKAQNQKANTKYQAGKLTVATVATGAMAAMDAALVGTAGGVATIPGAVVVLGSAAEALHYSVTGVGAASVLKERIGLDKKDNKPALQEQKTKMLDKGEHKSVEAKENSPPVENKVVELIKTLSKKSAQDSISAPTVPDTPNHGQSKGPRSIGH